MENGATVDMLTVLGLKTCLTICQKYSKDTYLDILFKSLKISIVLLRNKTCVFLLPQLQ